MQVQSTMGTVGLADVRQAGAAGPLMMFQLYVFKERDFVKQLIEREMCMHSYQQVDMPFRLKGMRRSTSRGCQMVALGAAKNALLRARLASSQTWPHV